MGYQEFPLWFSLAEWQLSGIPDNLLMEIEQKPSVSHSMGLNWACVIYTTTYCFKLSGLCQYQGRLEDIYNNYENSLQASPLGSFLD